VRVARPRVRSEQNGGLRGGRARNLQAQVRSNSLSQQEAHYQSLQLGGRSTAYGGVACGLRPPWCELNTMGDCGVDEYLARRFRYNGSLKRSSPPSKPPLRRDTCDVRWIRLSASRVPFWRICVRYISHIAHGARDQDCPCVCNLRWIRKS
jgi:hypothetical protein